MEGNFSVKIRTAFLAIFHPGSPQVFFGQTDLRQNEGRRWKREQERDIKEILIQAIPQGRTTDT